MVNDREILRALRGEITIDALRATTGLTDADFQTERAALLRRSLPPADQILRANTNATIEIIRDGHGIPHVYAESNDDACFGLGFAMAEDRLWQMDFFRRRGKGTLAEVLGPSYLASDITHRTLDLERIARSEADRLDSRTAATAEAFVGGINRAVEAALGRLPIEFALLDYEPDPWAIADVVVALRGFWWSLNGRLQSIIAAEAASLVPEGPLRDAYLTPNLADERILPPGSPYPAASLGLAGSTGGGRFGHGSDEGTTGSNNWAVGKRRTANGSSILASDPHQGFALPANWYECQVVTPSGYVAGAAWAGAPGIWFGRNQRIAWGLTNNNVSLRDLFAEDVDPTDSTRYRDGATWRTFDLRSIEIPIRGQPTHFLELRSTARGPIVNHLVPRVRAEGDPEISLRWVGLEPVDDLRALLAIGRAQNWNEFRDALRDWAIPTFNWGFADVDGNVGYQCASRVPIRGRSERGFRDANDPRDRWHGHLPFDAQPTAFNPERGFVSSANQAPVPDDFPFPYTGAFASGERAIRVRESIVAAETFDRAVCAELQNDTLSVAARQLVPHILGRTSRAGDSDVTLFRQHLASWDYHYEVDSLGPAFFEMFLRTWRNRVAEERFPAHLVELASGQGSVFARLLEDDDLAWFQGDKNNIVRECAGLAVAELRTRLGADLGNWAWGKLHQLFLHHPLSNPATTAALDVGPCSISGGGSTVRNTGLGASPLFAADSGSEYRLIVDLSDSAKLWATQNIGESGQPGSAHYQDQSADFVAGTYHVLPLERPAVEAEKTSRVRLGPSS